MLLKCFVLGCVALCAWWQDWYHERESRFREERWRFRLFEQVRLDLEHVQRVTWPDGRDGRRLERTKQKLRDLQMKLDKQRSFDRREVNEVIGSIEASAEDTRLLPRDKEVLRDDLNRLRDYREHHGEWGR